MPSGSLRFSCRQRCCLFSLSARPTRADSGETNAILWKSRDCQPSPTSSTNLKFTSFPVLFPTTVRIFTNLFGTSDASLRCFGFLVGVALLAVAWFNARSSCAPPPAQSTDCRSVSNSIPGALRCNRNQHALLSFLSVKNSALIFCIGRGLTETVLCSPNSKSSFHKRSKK